MLLCVTTIDGHYVKISTVSKKQNIREHRVPLATIDQYLNLQLINIHRHHGWN